MMRGFLGAGLLTAALILPSAPHAQQAGAIARGADLFDERCTMCHQREGGGQGPSLVGVVGRPAASAPGVNYSRALMASHLIWSPEELDRFLASPTERVPGTAMPLAVPNAAERADLIAYLGSKENHP
jgi:cytochrome c2